MTQIRVQSSVSIEAGREEVFSFVADWRNAPRYVPHLVDLRQTGTAGGGPGTRVRGRAKIDGWPLGCLAIESDSEIVEQVAGERIVCRSAGGVASVNTWLFRGGPHSTIVTAIITYELPVDLPGKIIGRLVGRQVVASVETMMSNLKREIEGRQ